jgi:hypothetical protein
MVWHFRIGHFLNELWMDEVWMFQTSSTHCAWTVTPIGTCNRFWNALGVEPILEFRVILYVSTSNIDFLGLTFSDLLDLGLL